MLHLLRYMRAYVKECILAPLFKLLEASFELMIPLVVKAIIDHGINGTDTAGRSYIIKMTGIMIFLGFVGLLSSVTAQYFAAKAATGFAAKLKSTLFSHMQSLSYTELDTLGTSAMITRLTSDVNTIQNGVNLVLRLFLRSPFIVFGAMVMAFTIDGKSALTFAAAIPLLSIVVFGIMLISIPLYRKVQKQLDRVLGTTRENLYGARVLRAFNKQDSETARFSEENSTLSVMQRFVGRISALMNPVTYIIINAAVIVLLQISSRRVYDGILTQGDVVALYNYMSQILVELIKLANLIITVTKAFASGARVNDVLQMQTTMTYPDHTITDRRDDNMVTFENVSLTYRQAGAPSISGVSFSVKRGQTVGVIGGTGSGKTSLVHLIPRFYDATEGEVLVDGINVKEYKKEDLRDKIGIVPQKAMLFSGTIADNLRWGKADASDEEMMRAVQYAQGADVIAAKEGGLYEPVAQSGRNFSGGQRQRLTIARALVKQPEILILDDSASALDYATDAALRKSLREMPGNPTVFLVSQRASSIRHADLILVLDDGVVVGQGTHEQLLETCTVYREIYESQFDTQHKPSTESEVHA